MMNKPIGENLSNEAGRLLQQLKRILSDRRDDTWLVGGTIRDLLEGQTPKDFDFAFTGDLTPQIKRWAAQQGGHWFWLDETRNQSRVLFTAKALQFDFAPLRAEDIDADLRLRDFTLNAMALALNDFPEELSGLIDPLGGQRDLKNNRLRSCGPSVLNDDPLRALKGVRHHALRGWQINDQTAMQMVQAAPLLSSVAGERIRNELGQILESPRLVSSVEMLERCAILDNLFPGIDKQALTQELNLLLTRLDQLQRVSCFAALLEQSIEEGLTRRTLLIMAALLRRIGPLSVVEEIFQRLRLSTRSRSILQTLYGAPASLEAYSDSDSPRVAALKLEVLGKNCLERVLFSLACFNQDKLDLLFSNNFNVYQQQLERGRLTDLLDGREIVSLSGLPPGQSIGDYQKQIKAAEIAGEISDKTTAEDWLRRQFSD